MLFAYDCFTYESSSHIISYTFVWLSNITFFAKFLLIIQKKIILILEISDIISQKKNFNSGFQSKLIFFLQNLSRTRRFQLIKKIGYRGHFVHKCPQLSTNKHKSLEHKSEEIEWDLVKILQDLYQAVRNSKSKIILEAIFMNLFLLIYKLIFSLKYIHSLLCLNEVDQHLLGSSLWEG